MNITNGTSKLEQAQRGYAADEHGIGIPGHRQSATAKHGISALLYLALKANDFDFVRTSVRSLARGMRMSDACASR